MNLAKPSWKLIFLCDKTLVIETKKNLDLALAPNPYLNQYEKWDR